MKKIILLLFISAFVFSCAPKRVCGGAGGKRCVEVAKNVKHNNV